MHIRFPASVLASLFVVGTLAPAAGLPDRPRAATAGKLVARADGGSGNAARDDDAAARRGPSGGKEVLAAVLRRLRETGEFNHPDCPWAVRARYVRGDTLYFVEFLCRRGDGKGLDRVGKAVQVTLTFAPEYRPGRGPFDDAPPPVRRNVLLARVYQMNLHTDYVDISARQETIDLDLPSRMPAGGYRPFTEATALLTEDQREAFDKDYLLRPEQKLLVAAFGDGCLDMLQGQMAMGATGRTVAAWDGPVQHESRGRYRFTRFAVARFDEAGAVESCFRGRDVMADADGVGMLQAGDEFHALTLEGAGGARFALPGVKAAK